MPLKKGLSGQVFVAHICNTSYWQAEIRRISVRSLSGANSSRDPVSKIPNRKKGW
jgi:hypothetical protein